MIFPLNTNLPYLLASSIATLILMSFQFLNFFISNICRVLFLFLGSWDFMMLWYFAAITMDPTNKKFIPFHSRLYIILLISSPSFSLFSLPKDTYYFRFWIFLSVTHILPYFSCFPFFFSSTFWDVSPTWYSTILWVFPRTLFVLFLYCFCVFFLINYPIFASCMIFLFSNILIDVFWEVIFSLSSLMSHVCVCLSWKRASSDAW